MVGIWAFNRGAGGERGDDEEIALGAPDTAEREDLARHVDRCAMRYRLISLRQRTMNNGLRRVELLVWGIGIIIFLTSGPGSKAVSLLFGAG
jgi:hypothetical protein